MSAPDATQITELLAAVQRGDESAGHRLFPLVYEEMRRAAARLMASERADHTLNATDLVHEVWLRIGLSPSQGIGAFPVSDRAHFLNVMVRSMRQVLIDHARRRVADKRGGGAIRVTLNDSSGAHDTTPEDMLVLFDALEKLGEIDERLRKVVEYRYLVGLTDVETAETLGVTTRTVQRDWVKARAWLYRQLYADVVAP